MWLIPIGPRLLSAPASRKATDVLKVSPGAERDLARASEDEYVEAIILTECLDRLEKQPRGLCVNSVANLRAVDGDDEGPTLAFRSNLGHSAPVWAPLTNPLYLLVRSLFYARGCFLTRGERFGPGHLDSRLRGNDIVYAVRAQSDTFICKAS